MSSSLCHVICGMRWATLGMNWDCIWVISPGNVQLPINVVVSIILHRALCCLFRPDTDGTRVSKCGQLSQQTRRLDPMLFQCWSSAVGGGPILKQHLVKCSRFLGSTQVSVYTHPSATIIFSPADQGTFSKTAGQSQAHYNTWNWEQGTFDVNHLHISTCEGAVSRVSSVVLYWP